jgi:hypothetical protein
VQPHESHVSTLVNKQVGLPADLLFKQLSRADAVISSAQAAQSGFFGEPERLLLSEARERFHFELKSADSLHSKSMLFLTLTGVFVAVVGTLMARVLDRRANTELELAARAALLVALVLLAIAALRLANSALSRKYQVVAAPTHWLATLGDLRQKAGECPILEGYLANRIQHLLMEALTEAVQACSIANEAKARSLERVATLLQVAILLAVVSAILLLLQP